MARIDAPPTLGYDRVRNGHGETIPVVIDGGRWRPCNPTLWCFGTGLVVFACSEVMWQEVEEEQVTCQQKEDIPTLLMCVQEDHSSCWLMCRLKLRTGDWCTGQIIPSNRSQGSLKWKKKQKLYFSAHWKTSILPAEVCPRQCLPFEELPSCCISYNVHKDLPFSHRASLRASSQLSIRAGIILDNQAKDA